MDLNSDSKDFFKIYIDVAKKQCQQLSNSAGNAINSSPKNS